MTARNLLGDLSLELTQDQLLQHMTYFLAAIYEKMARVDSADRMAVSIEAGSVGIAASQTLATVTQVGACNVNVFGGRDASHTSYALANAGAMHIYDNIKVS